MNTPGTSNPLLVIGDADGLIALLYSDDTNHDAAKQAAQKLASQRAEVLFPLTAIVEATTTLQRRLNNPPLVERIRQQVIAGELLIEEVEKDTLLEANKRFNPFGSKQNTLFDAIVATVAAKYATVAIFSFDDWYTKQGLTVIPGFT